MRPSSCLHLKYVELHFCGDGHAYMQVCDHMHCALFRLESIRVYREPGDVEIKRRNYRDSHSDKLMTFAAAG